MGRAVVPGPVPVAGEEDTVVPFTNIRRRTAEHMVRSKATSAHTMIAVEVDYSAVDRVRQAEKDRFKAAEGFSLTYLPFIARAVVDALTEWPYLNSSVGDDELIVHGEVNLGIAVDLDFEGLLVPVVHRAEEKRLVALAREISSLASRARSKHLTMDDISGGTFTLTNAGGYGTFITVPVINQPQVAILSTDGVRKRPVVVETARRLGRHRRPSCRQPGHVVGPPGGRRRLRGRFHGPPARRVADPRLGLRALGKARDRHRHGQLRRSRTGFRGVRRKR